MPVKIGFKVTIPDKIFDSQQMIDRIANAQRTITAPALRRLFQQTTVGWNKKPGWLQNQEIKSNYIAITVFAGGQYAWKYALVNNGAAPHPIYPVNAPRLRFQPGYTPSTRPGVLSSRPKGRFGSFVSVMAVSHPGFEARKFDQAVADAHYPDFIQDMQDAIRRAP